METLLRAGANADARNLHGYTAILLAAKRQSIGIVKTLINFNADVNIAAKVSVWQIGATCELYHDLAFGSHHVDLCS